MPSPSRDIFTAVTLATMQYASFFTAESCSTVLYYTKLYYNTLYCAVHYK